MRPPARLRRAEAEPQASSGAVRRELRYALLGLGGGILVLPGLVYLAGSATLGPYEGGVTPFLTKLYGDLAHLSPGALLLVCGPYVMLQVLRVASRPLRRPRD
jgi:hypothetical protein